MAYQGYQASYSSSNELSAMKPPPYTINTHGGDAHITNNNAKDMKIIYNFNVDVTPLADALRADPSQAGAQMRAVLQETNLEPLSAELHHQIEGSQANYNVGDATDNQVAIYNPNVQDLSAYSINHTPPDRGDGFLESLSGKMTQLKQLYKSIIDPGQRQNEWDHDFDAGNKFAEGDGAVEGCCGHHENDVRERRRLGGRKTTEEALCNTVSCAEHFTQIALDRKSMLQAI